MARLLSVCLCVVCSHFADVFSSGTTGQIEVKFHVEPPWDGGMKVCIRGPGHMTKLAAMPIYGKNLLLRNRWADLHETWYVASGMWAHHKLHK